jgi:predicted nucleic acid-binding protein
MILLDTSVLVAAYRRKPPQGKESSAAIALRRMIGAGMALGIPAIVLQEVLAGVQNKTQLQELHSHLMAFRILPATVEDHVNAAQLSAACSAKRIVCTSSAALVVTQAKHSGWRLYTLDRELAAVARIGGVELAGTRETAGEPRRGA